MAAKKKNHITKRLGLEPMPQRPTLAEYAERRAILVKKIESGKLSGLLLQRAKEYVASLDYKVRQKRAKSIEKKAPASKAKITAHDRKVKAAQAKLKAQLDAGQMQLPGFLAQMDVVRIEELVAAKIASQIMQAFNADQRHVEAKEILKRAKRGA